MKSYTILAKRKKPGFNMIKFAEATVLEAGRKFQSIEIAQTGDKVGDGNWVTNADEELQDFIISQIRSKFPEHKILAEEGEQSSLSGMDKGPVWILDPLDGTTDATKGFPFFGISLAFMQDGNLKFGVILDIPNQKLYKAEVGKGAFVNDQPMVITEDKGLKGEIAITGAPYSRENFQKTHHLMNKVHEAGARLVLLGSTVIEGMYIAEGRSPLYFEHGLNPWDVAALSVIIPEAGGAVATSVDGKLNILNFDLFAAGTKTGLKEFLALAA